MTTEKAIQLLHRLSDEQFDGIHGDERREALSMAVRALEPNLGQKTIDCIIERLNDEDRTTDDTISRQAAIVTAVRAAIDWHRLANPQYSIAYCIGEAMRQLPSVQPQSKKGKWIDNDKINFPQCSECGMWIDVMQQSGEMNFCPNCGADMRGKSE